MNTPLAIGDFVRCSDGTPQPPAHHKKKLRSWQYHNFTGWIHSMDSYGIGIDSDGSKMLVKIMNPRTHTIEAATAA